MRLDAQRWLGSAARALPSRATGASFDGSKGVPEVVLRDIASKNYPGDAVSRLDRPDAFRVNVAASKETFVRWTGHAPRESATIDVDPSPDDTVIAHPV